MKRYARNKNLLNPKPVEQIEVQQKHVKLRVVAFVCFIALAIACFAIVLSLLLKVEAGWVSISVNTDSANASGEFVFSYYFDKSQDKHYRSAVQQKYTDASVYAYNVFCQSEQLGGLNNLHYLNAHPNEEMQIPELLYGAIKAFEDAESRFLYYAPIYERYDALISMTNDYDAALCDPTKNDDVKKYVEKMIEFAKSETHVKVELLENNTVKLVVSDEYRNAFGDMTSTYIDFSWTKNAFVVDYIAENMIASGYSCGVISSYDGFTRNLDDAQDTLNANIIDVTTSENGKKSIAHVATISYTQKTSVVMLKSYPISSSEDGFYIYEDGSVRSRFVSMQDGMNASAISMFTAYSQSKSCADITLNIIPVYLAQTLDKDALKAIKADGIFSLYCENNKVCCNDKSMKITPVEREGGTYGVECIL